MPIIFITGHGNVPTSVQAMKAGAVEFLMKPFNTDALLSAVRQALDQSHASLVEVMERRALHKCYATLTRREREVLNLVVAGRLNKQIAGELGVNEVTVKAHRGRMMRKMEANSVADLVKMAAKLHPEPRG